MSLFTFASAVNFRIELAAIDALTVADVDQTIEDDLFGTPISRTEIFEDFGSPGTELQVVYNYLTDTTSFTVFGGSEYQFSMVGEFDIAGGYELEAGIAAITGTEPDYISSAPGAVIDAFGTRDEMIGEGRFLGRGGRDKIELEDISGGDGLGDAGRSFAIGGGGWDILKAAVQLSTLKGGNGQDTLVLEFGKSTLVGGNHADDFIVDNGFWDVTGTAAQGAANARGRITDFDVVEGDEFIFATVDGALSTGDAPQRESLADRFGAGDMETLADFVDDGLTHRFWDNAWGNAVFRRFGTDGEGRSYDEKVIVKGVTLAEIDRADVVLQDYNADTYEFF